MLSIEESLNIFGISSITSINEDSLKKTFRRLIRNNHPDLGGDITKAQKINEAYSLLKDALHKRQSVPKEENHVRMVCKIRLEDIVEVYKGRSLIMASDNGEKIIITKDNIDKYKVIVVETVEISYRNEWLKFENLEIKNKMDRYSITCRILDDRVDVQEITIKAHEKTVTKVIESNRKDIVLSFDGLVTLVVQIERIEYNG